MRKRFISINESFVCAKCGWHNLPLDVGCRNHCVKCLWSRHVDRDIPGDRLSECGGMMMPLAVDKSGKKGFMVAHECEKCGKEILNKVAEDDDFDEVIRISRHIS